MSSNQFVGLSFPSSNSNSTTTPSIHSFYSKSTSTSTLQNPTNTTFLELDVCSLAKMYQQPPKQSRLNQLIGNFP
uniref:Ovule protein n=1 Tax=Panagrolaimus sp. PS1159 TaxID=55785 RepID=A0AC35F8Z4_9BILA